MNKKCLIISGGEFCLPDEDSVQFDFVIACDKGYEYAVKLDIKPNLILGDFDSISKKYKSILKEQKNCSNVEIQEYPPEKDDTDTMLAAKTAFSKGYKDITILCGFGNRLDHAFANIQTAAYIVKNGGTAKIIGASDILYAFTNATVSFTKTNDFSLSIFAYSKKCTGVSIKGAKYEIADSELEHTFPLGVSNEWKENEVQISVEKGILMVIKSSVKKEDL